ncbi:MAG TPA: hypothetical protein VE258_01795 [Ktedonobacterales bacterium]|nr:hypothetical protein [Ktedonobacterales bacterium]
MPRFPTRPARALLGALALLCLAACTPMASGPPARPGIVGRAPTAAPARVPAGWKVLATPHFRLAYPPDWAPESPSRLATPPADPWQFHIDAPAHQLALRVDVVTNANVSDFCPVGAPTTRQFQPTTLAGLPMKYLLVAYPNGGGLVRWWVFANAQHTSYKLRAFDGEASAATQAQDDAILATFRPDNATPLQC